MVIDSKGNIFEDRRKKERRKDSDKINNEKRTGKDRRDPKNGYKV